MRTIGTRLTVLYVVAVAGAVVAVLLLGRYLLERHLVATLDAQIQSYYDQIQDRLGTDTGPDEVRGLLAASGISSDLAVQIDDLWRDPTHRAFSRPSGHLRFFTALDAAANEVRIGEGTSGSLRIRLSLPLQPAREALRDYSRVAGGVALLVVGLGIFAGRLLSRTALRPVRMIEHTAARIGSGNLSERIPVGQVQDEISNLARLLNETFDRLQSSFEQIQRFAGDASHELKTPLALIRLNIERVVLDPQTVGASREALQDAIEQIHHLDRLIERLLFLSRAQAGEVALDREPFHADEFIGEFAHDAEMLAQAAGRSFVVAHNDPGRVSADRARLRQVLLNLLSNALRATPEGGRVELYSQITPEGGWSLRMTDEGPGVPADKLEAIFGRFVRLHSTGGGGAGLGLAITRSIVELHRGRIHARNRADRSGLEMLIELPSA